MSFKHDIKISGIMAEDEEEAVLEAIKLLAKTLIKGDPETFVYEAEPREE